MQAVIMAGGAGTRLRPLTDEYVKPMIPLVNKPVLAHLLNLLKRHHISDVVMTVQYLAEQIQFYFGNGSRLGMSIRYVVEDTPLGTAGGVKNVQSLLDDEPFLVISGDLITDINLSALVQFHRKKQALTTLALAHQADPLEYGVVLTDNTGRITEFVEKPDPEEVVSHIVNTGIYVLEPEALDYMQPQACDFSDDIFPKMLRKKAALLGYIAAGYWCDMGTIKDYRQATADILQGQVNHINLGHHLGGEAWAGGEVTIGAEVVLRGPIYLGPQVEIKPGVSIYGPTVVLDHTVIEKHAQIEQSIIGRDSFVGEMVKLQRCIVARSSHLTAGSVISDEILTSGEAA
ncbi:MAG: NDP-sugar synthase [Anaerolineae bacterium]|nr:NDP-sugar synthase [Anaerolineae bacterium]